MSVKLYTGVAKGLGYTAFAINQCFRAVKSGSKAVAETITNTKKYKVELIVEGATLKTKENQTSQDVIRTIENMEDYGVTGVIIHEQSKV